MKLKINHLSKSFGGHVALADLALQVENIHSLVLIGPSGGGKTTLLRILAGLETPDAGEVELDGEKMQFDEPSLRQHRRRIGVVFQAFNLFPHLTARQNITLPLEKVHGHSPESALAIADQLLTRFQLAGHALKRPGELSGGQRQRVAIARAIAIQPRALLLDEPTSALDPEMTAEVLDMIRELPTGGRDIVVVTHQMGFARMVGEEVAFIADGRVLECAPGEELFRQPQTKACLRFLERVLKY